jgi:cytoskeletal protein CcmA (bactofilin family)
MMPELAFMLLLAGAVLWLLLPLVPALRELMRPTDANPLTQVGHDSGDLAVFAEGFRRYVSQQLPAPDTAAGSSGAGALRDGTPFVRLDGVPQRLRDLADTRGAVRHVVVAEHATSLPGGETFLNELHAHGPFLGGPDAVYRALLAEQDAELGAGSRVLRWAHAEGDLAVGDGTTLEGRASAAGEIRLGRGVAFARLRGARIVVGDAVVPEPVELPPVFESTVKLTTDAHRYRGFVRVTGDLTIPDDGVLLGSLVVTGTLRLGARARIGGSVKVHGDCHAGAGSAIDGALVARGRIVLGAAARANGPVIAEGALEMREDAAVGRADLPGSIVAATILLQRGAQVFGAVSAREGGTTAE